MPPEMEDSESGDVVTLMYVPGLAGNIRRVRVRRRSVRWIVGAAVSFVLLTALLTVDYVHVRRELIELDRLRVETDEQRGQILDYSDRMETVQEKLTQISQFDRKLRVITNLDSADPYPLPGIGGVEEAMIDPHEWTGLTRDRRHQKMMEGMSALDKASGGVEQSLTALIAHLEDQSARLVATPSVTPTKGWMTSSFGYRTSPFTGNREFHRGLDIAGRMNTPIVAPADGEVRFRGKQRALGNTVILRHGYGVETIYGHLEEILVKSGEKVKRGQRIALMGSTGRSTGPHVHYQVEVNGAPVNPSNYILD